MTAPTRLSDALATLHWGPQVASRILDVNERTVRRWLVGQNEPPSDILAWVEQCASFVRDHPPPRK